MEGRFGRGRCAEERLRRQNVELREQLRRQTEACQHLELYDGLTGLPNRKLFVQQLDAALEDAGPLAVLLVGLDRFREINDTLGHHHGDELLRSLGERLQDVCSTVTAGAVVARFGSDEFSVMVPGLGTLHDARRIALEVGSALRAAVSVAEIRVTVDARTGIALAPDHGSDHTTLLRRADVAMQLAKSDHSEVEVYRRTRDAHSTDRLVRTERFRASLEAGTLAVHFQPQVELATGTVVGAEALVRWAGDGSMDIAPSELVALAERTGMIRSLTAHVLREATRECARWRAAGRDLQVSVNLSSHDLLDFDLVRDVCAELESADLPATSLCLELTETSAMVDPERTIAVLRELHDAGVGISVDDFGTGYSSLAYLSRLPVDEVKIDRSFVLEMDESRNDAMIVASMVELARTLELRSVAEGVESDGVRTQLDGLGCSRAQGYLFSRALPAEELAAWLGIAGTADASTQIDLVPVRGRSRSSSGVAAAVACA